MRRTVIVLVVGSILVIINAGIALGKGPESVTLTGPGIDSPVDLMDAVDWPISCDNSCPPDPMVQLMEQSGLWYATGDLPVAIDQPPARLGPQHVLTWIRSGAPGETTDSRTIRQFLYLQAPNGPLVHTPDQESLQDWGSGVTGWFRASEDLADTLASLGAPPSEAEEGVPVADQSPEHLGIFAATGSATLVLIWDIRRRSCW